VRTRISSGPFCFPPPSELPVGSAQPQQAGAFFISINRGQRNNVIRDALDFSSSQVDILSWFSVRNSRFRVLSCFSNPPIRCSSPGVPGNCPFACKRRIVAQVGEIIIRVFPELWEKYQECRQRRSFHGSEPFQGIHRTT